MQEAKTRKNTEFWDKKEGFFVKTPLFLVGRGGFEPPKSKTSDLQSDPFGRSGICPFMKLKNGAGDRNRTNNLLITNQLLCRLSYTGKVVPWGGIEPPTDGFSVRCSTI